MSKINDEYRRQFVSSHAGLWSLFEDSDLYDGQYSKLREWIGKNRDTIDQVIREYNR